MNLDGSESNLLCTFIFCKAGIFGMVGMKMQFLEVTEINCDLGFVIDGPIFYRPVIIYNYKYWQSNFR